MSPLRIRAKEPAAPRTRLVTLVVLGYATTVICLWLALDLLADRALAATLVAFGPRWLVALPALPLAVIALRATERRVAQKLIGILAVTGLILIFGLMDYRMGLGRVAGTPVLRIMTHNVGGSRVTGRALDRFMNAERIDVAALQECPFYDNDMDPFDWHFYYGGNLCLVSRYPFAVLDGAADVNSLYDDPERFTIDTPLGRLQLLNLHLGTIRGGLEALGAGRWGGLAQFAYNRAESAVESRATRERVSGGTGPVVVVGDFNLPVESAIYRAHWGDLRNAFSTCGRGFGHTKFTNLFGIRIDHVLTSAPWRCADARVLSSPYGGDHVPLVVDLVLRD